MIFYSLSIMRREVATWGHHNSPRSTAIIACNHTFDSHGRVDSHPRPFGDGHGCVRYVSLGKWSKYNIHKPFWRADSLLPWLDTSCFIFRSKEVATQMWAPKFLRGPRGNLRQLRSRVGNEQHSSIWRAYRFSPWFKPCITQRNYRTRFGYSGWYWTQHPSSLDLQLGMVSSRSRSLWPPNSTKTFINKDIDIKWQR